MITTELYQTEKSMEKALKKETSGDIAVFGDERVFLNNAEVRARQALERAQEQLRQKQSIREYYMSKASMARALSRLKASQHKGSEYHGL